MDCLNFCWKAAGIRKWMLVVLFYVLSPAVSAQEYSYAQLNVKDGLAGSVVYCGVEDKEGFLWFGTETGLSRFDGTHFKNFTTADGLPDNEILRLYVDSRNRVWILPFRNKLCYYYQGTIHNQANDPVLAKVKLKSDVFEIVESAGGHIVIITEEDMYSLKDTVLTRHPSPLGDFTNYLSVGMSGTGRLVLLCNRIPYKHSVVELDGRSLSFIRTYTLPGWGNRADQGVFPGVMVTNSHDSLCFILPGGKISATYKVPFNFSSFSYINDSIVSINTRKGCIIYNYRAKRVLRQCLMDKAINNVMTDSEGNYWFMTAGAGIIRIGSFGFRSYLAESQANDHKFPVFSIRKVQDRVYAGCAQSTFWELDPVTLKKTEHILPGLKEDARLSCLDTLPDHSLVWGTDAGVIRTGLNKYYMSVLKPSVKALCNFGDSILLATNIGVYISTREAGFTRKVIFRKRMTAAVLYKDLAYLGTLDGVYTVDHQYRTAFLGNISPVLNNRIAFLAVQPDGLLWIATNGQGIAAYKDGRIIHQITMKQGLSSNICRTIYIAGNEIWVGTDKGLNRVRINPGKSYGVTVFTRDDGLIADIVNAVYVDGSKVYAGTSEGLTYFDADSIANNSFCKLRITGILSNGFECGNDSARLVLPHRENNLRIDFVGISYRSAGKISYRYRLAGLNDNWQTTRETYLTYPSLPSGDYELQIIAVNKFGVESEMVKFPFTIEKLLWEKTWFRLLLLTLGIISVWLFVNSRIRSLKRQNDEKLQISARMAELEQMALKAQMNPHFIFNSLNSLQQYVIDKDVLGANKFISDFSRLIRQTLDISSKATISLYEEVSYLTTYLELEKTKYEDKFNYVVSVSPELDAAEWFIPPMILQPYVENSIRHGVRGRKDKQGKIRVHFSKSDTYLICVVEDNGVGRETARIYKSQMAMEYQSKGMTLTAKRIEMLNRELDSPVLIDIEDLQADGVASGTRVTICFPLEGVSKG